MVHLAAPFSIFSTTFVATSTGSSFANPREWSNDFFPLKKERVVTSLPKLRQQRQDVHIIFVHVLFVAFL
jgi:hypothetical protein